jgi:signal transduction histidine kinase/ActR/RegA family two-component response regulator
MGKRIRAFDWEITPLGPPEGWPSALKTLTNLMLASKQPMFLGWGTERTWIYNDAFIPILGRKHPGALGQPSMQVWSEAREVLEPMFDRVFAGEPVSIEDFALGIDRQGQIEEAHFEFAYTPARGEDGSVQGLFGSCIETTARVMAERRQTQATERQRRQFQCAPGFIAILNGPEHVFEFVNDAYVRLLGDRDFVGKAAQEAVPEVAGQGFFEVLDRVYSTGRRYIAHQTPIKIIRSSGGLPEDRHLDFVYEPIFDETNRVSGIFVEGFDVTETYQAQQKLRELNETLEQRVEEHTREREIALQKLHESQKLESIGQLTGGVAHYFNNLLAIILGSLGLLKKIIPENPKITRLLDRAIQGAERGAALTARLLAFARRQELKVESVALQKLIPEMLDFLRHSVGPNIVVHVNVSSEIYAIEVDANQLELALVNLAVNARDAMPEGGSLTIACHNEENGKRVGLPRDPFVCITVTDTGVGMTEATLAKAQEPFFTTKGIGKGTGLGLSMVQGFTAQSGGAMRIRSEPGKGTTVTMWLPRAKESPKAANAEKQIAYSKEAKSLRVLLVDDDILVSMGAADMLLDLGHRVTEAQSGADALKLLEAALPFDIVVTDYAMPGMNGFELAQRIKEKNPKLPVILATGYAELPADRSIEFGHLPKPYTSKDLAAALEEAAGAFSSSQA